MTNKKIARQTKRTKRPTSRRAKPLKMAPLGPTVPECSAVTVDRGPLPEGLIDRAAERAGIKPTADDRAQEFIDSLAACGQTLSPPALSIMGRLIRSAGDDAALADAFERASHRAEPSIPPPLDPIVEATEQRERDRVVAAIGPRIAKACDLLSAEIAEIRASGGGDDYQVVGALLELWRVRWEIGFTSDEALPVDGEDEDKDEQPAKVAS